MALPIYRWISCEIPGTPPSINALPLDSRNPKYRRERAAWTEKLHYVMRESGNVLPTRLERVEVSALLTFTTKRRRDEGNYRAHLEKWVGDLLQSNGRLVDDTPDLYRFGGIAFVQGSKESTVLIVDYDLAEAVA